MVLKNKQHLEELIGYKVSDLHLDTVRDLEIEFNGTKWKFMGDVFDCWYESEWQSCKTTRP